jgi:hypothetical protein
MIPY